METETKKQDEEAELDSEEEGLHLWGVFLKVLTFVLVILVVPIFGYFISKALIFQYILRFSTDDSNFWAASVSIALLHIALAAFLYVAFSAKPKEEKVE